jgi:hypothetical protein
MKASARPRADATITLADGRTLAYCEWGDPTGSPVLSAVLPNSRLALYPQDGHLLLLQHWEDLLTAVTAGALTKEPAAGQQEHGGRAAPQ